MASSFPSIRLLFWGCKHGVRKEGNLNSPISEHPVIFCEVSKQKLSDLFLINCMFLYTAPSAIVSDMIHNLDRYVVFISLGLLDSWTHRQILLIVLLVRDTG